MKLRNKTFLLAASAFLSGCATASDIQELADGNYKVSAYAAPARGGAAGAQDVAYKDAQKFCAGKGGRAVVVGSNERDLLQAGGGAVFQAGNATIVFKCQSGN